MTYDELTELNTEIFLNEQKRNHDLYYRQFMSNRVESLLYVWMFGVICLAILGIIYLIKYL